jgi:hypothetical protein
MLPKFIPMLFPTIVMITLPVPGLLAGMIPETTTASYEKAFKEDPRSEPTETVIEIRDAEPSTLNDKTPASGFCSGTVEMKGFVFH